MHWCTAAAAGQAPLVPHRRTKRHDSEFMGEGVDALTGLVILTAAWMHGAMGHGGPACSTGDAYGFIREGDMAIWEGTSQVRRLTMPHPTLPRSLAYVQSSHTMVVRVDDSKQGQEGDQGGCQGG